MEIVKLTISLTREEARESLLLYNHSRSKSKFKSLGIRLGIQVALGLGLSLVAIILSQIFDHPDPVSEMFSVLSGAAAIMVIWQMKWSKSIRTTVEEMENFSAKFGPTEASFQKSGIELCSAIGTAHLPWVAIHRILTAKKVTVLRYGTQMIVVPHRCLPDTLAPMEFDKLLEDWNSHA